MIGIEKKSFSDSNTDVRITPSGKVKDFNPDELFDGELDKKNRVLIEKFYNLINEEDDNYEFLISLKCGSQRTTSVVSTNFEDLFKDVSVVLNSLIKKHPK